MLLEATDLSIRVTDAFMEDRLGIAPSTQGLKDPCSTSELAVHILLKLGQRRW